MKNHRIRRPFAALLRRVAERLHPAPASRRAVSTIDILLKQPFAARLDFDALGQGEVRIAYRATDTIWRDIAGDGGCIGLRDHVQHLCLAALELNEHPVCGAWDGVAYVSGTGTDRSTLRRVA